MAGRTSLREKKLPEDFLKDPPWEEIEIHIYYRGYRF